MIDDCKPECVRCGETVDKVDRDELCEHCYNDLERQREREYIGPPKNEFWREP